MTHPSVMEKPITRREISVAIVLLRKTIDWYEKQDPGHPGVGNQLETCIVTLEHLRAVIP